MSNSRSIQQKLPLSGPAPADHRQSAPSGTRYRAPARLIGGQFQIETLTPVLLLTALSLACCVLSFPPFGWWPLAFVCLAPWLTAVCTTERPIWVYLSSYAFGLGYFFILVRWLALVTLPGYLALGIFFGFCFPLAALPLRHMFRRHGASMAIALPIVWTGVEYARSQSLAGFPWYLLAHTNYRILPLIQIADVAGAYGVSFVIAVVNGWVADLLIQPIMIWRREQPERTTRLPIGSLVALVIVSLTLIYGAMARSDGAIASAASRDASSPDDGPRVAVIQGDFPMYVDPLGISRTSWTSMFHSYLALVRRAAAEKPDLIVLPETAWPGHLNAEFLQADPDSLEWIRRKEFPNLSPADMETYRQWCRNTRQAVWKVAQDSGASVVIGAASIVWKPMEIPPRVEKYNSAFVLPPTTQAAIQRYDKVHLVLFGEFVPFRYGRLHSVYKWLNGITPWGAAGIEYSLMSGEEFNAFEVPAPSLGGRSFLIGAPICYEDTVPYVARSFSAPRGRTRIGPPDAKNIDILLNISNDGWFMHSSELEQHLAASVFRAVENRVGVARSVNTGASALIDPDGRIRDRVELSTGKQAQLSDVRSALKRLRLLTAQSARQSELFKAWNDVRDALIRMGEEFTFMSERLMPLLPAAASGDGSPNQLLQQIVDDLATVDRWKRRPGTAPGYRIARLRVDSRETIYARWGDWFGSGCLLLMVVMIADWLMHRVRGRGRDARGPAVRTAMLAAGLLLLPILGACELPQNREPTLDQQEDMERRALYLLQSATADDSPLYRMHAIEALQEVAGSEGRSHIRACLRDENRPVRFAALMALGTMRDRASREAFKQAAEDNDGSVRAAGIFGLHRLGDYSRTSELASLLLKNPDPKIRGNAALAIGRLGERKSVKLLSRARNDQAESVRLEALEAMAQLGDEKAARDLVFYGHSGVGQKMVEALMALGTARISAARELFIYRLSEGPYDEVRLASARGLGCLGQADGFDLSLRMLSFQAPQSASDIDPPEQQEMRVRTLAASALQTIGDRRALPKLAELMQSTTELMPVRIASARAILGIIRYANHPLRSGMEERVERH